MKKIKEFLLFVVIYTIGVSALQGSGVSVADGTVTATGASGAEMTALLETLATFATFLISDVAYYLLYISMFIGALSVLMTPGDDIVPALQVMVRVVFTGSLLVGGTTFIATYVLPSGSVI